MIKQGSLEDLKEKIYGRKKGPCPVSAQIDLTYMCNLDCIHCYCRGAQEEGDELDTEEWISIIDQIHASGATELTISGGEPLVREDFLKIYAYAKRKGFFVTVFSNGILLDEKIIRYMSRCPPYMLEVSLYGINESTYQSITGPGGDLKRLMDNIEAIAAAGIPLTIKTVGLKQNKDEILDIKDYSQRILGKGRFKFDSFIMPRLNGDKTPCMYRLMPEEILKIEESDSDMRIQREKEFSRHKSLSWREPEYKYHCNAWFNQFYITPYGRLKFCYMTDNYSTDLKNTTLIEGIYKKFPLILKERYSTDSECIYCGLRQSCLQCPPKAYLETGSEENPVPYLCELAKMNKNRMNRQRHPAPTP